jgi:hypothetical protein
MGLPSRSLHSIEGALFGPGAKKVIAAKVGGKFSVRCVVRLSLSVSGIFFLFLALLARMRAAEG